MIAGIAKIAIIEKQRYGGEILCSLMFVIKYETGFYLSERQSGKSRGLNGFQILAIPPVWAVLFLLSVPFSVSLVPPW